MERKEHFLRRIDIETLIPDQLIAMWDEKLVHEQKKRREYAALIYVPLVAVIPSLVTNSGLITGLALLIGIGIWAFLSDAQKNALYHLIPSAIRIDRHLTEVEESKLCTLKEAESVKQQLEARPEWYIADFANLLEKRTFSCPTLKDDQLVKYFSLSYQQRGNEIPLNHYTAIIKAILNYYQPSEEQGAEKQFLIERARLLDNVSNHNEWDELVDATKMIFQEIGTSFEIPETHQVLMTRVNESIDEVNEFGGWYDGKERNIVKIIRAYKDGLLEKSPEIEKLKHAVEEVFEDNRL